jgi:hypothetical protein
VPAAAIVEIVPSVNHTIFEMLEWAVQKAGDCPVITGVMEEKSGPKVVLRSGLVNLGRKIR